jgi:hypothetical protein
MSDTGNGAGHSPVPTRDFEDYVALGVKLVENRNSNAWQLGDLAVDFMKNFAVKPGRPADPNIPTLSDLAGAWDVEIQRVSEWRSVSAFYNPNLRMNEVSWSHHNMARRASEDVEEALELLEMAVNLHFSVAEFRRYLNGTLYEGDLWVEQLPEHLRMYAPEGTQKVWIVLKKYHEVGT